MARRERTEAALLVSVGAPRQRLLGYDVPPPFSEPEIGLYQLLAQRGPAAARSRYNSLIRRLVRFERAAACAGAETAPG